MKFNIFSCFQILFYPGSNIKPELYSPFLKSLPITKDDSIHIVKNPFPFKTSSSILKYGQTNNTILIGHSMGGYNALLDAKKYPDKIKGIVLINSHFNERGKMFYPRIHLSDIKVPTLTILADKDNRLPLTKSIDDLFVSIQKLDDTKYFVINNNFDHFTGLTKDFNNTIKLIEPISLFFKSIQTKNFKLIRSETISLKEYYNPQIARLVPNAFLLSNSINIIDAILQYSIPRVIWNFVHWILFLISKPSSDLNYIFEDSSIFIKCYGVDSSNLHSKIITWSHNEKDIFIPIEIRIPTFHPFILIWLFYPTLVFKNNNVIYYTLVSLKVNQNITYFKIPHPNDFYIKEIN